MFFTVTGLSLLRTLQVWALFLPGLATFLVCVELDLVESWCVGARHLFWRPFWASLGYYHCDLPCLRHLT